MWAACQAAQLPVHTHSGEAPREEMNDFIGIYLAEVVFWTHRPIAHLLFSGAFERFPGLKFVVTEGACYWVADMKWKWDQYLGGGHTTKKMAALMKGILSKLPSEYFGENIFVGASTMSKEEIRRRHTIGCDVAMWGTDYPHPEGTWPNTIARLRSDFGDVPVGDTRQMLGETAARCYGFDLDALRPIAERIGPTPADLGQDTALVTTADEIRRGRVVEGRVPRAVGRVTMDDVAGKVAVVTGGANGIGRGIVEALLDEGARVVIADVEQPVLERTVAELRDRGEVIGIRTDVSDFDVGRVARGVGLRALRRLSPALQQRRRHDRGRRPAVGAGAQRLEVVLRRQRVRRCQRRARVRTPDDRVGRARRRS